MSVAFGLCGLRGALGLLSWEMWMSWGDVWSSRKLLSGKVDWWQVKQWSRVRRNKSQSWRTVGEAGEEPVKETETELAEGRHSIMKGGFIKTKGSENLTNKTD